MSVHVRGRAAESPEVAAAVTRCLDAIADDERVFSPFLPTSDISRLRRGEIIPIDPRVADVGARCDELRDASGGRFDADHQGWFDPTGLVKGWSVERAADIHLRPLLSQAGIDAVGINAGGDVRVFTAAHAEWDWAIGIADPRRPDGLCGVVHLRDGAVATSGTSERGAHLVDARTGTVRRGIIGATVVAGDLLTADSWATVAAIAGIADAGWVANAPIDSAMIVEGDVVRQWANGVELTAHEPVWPPLTPQGA